MADKLSKCTIGDVAYNVHCKYFLTAKHLGDLTNIGSRSRVKIMSYFVNSS